MKLFERRRALMSLLSKFIRFISGKPPITLEGCVDDKSTIDYKLYGESVQDGTPTPDTPIEVESVGILTEALIDLPLYRIPIVVSGKNLINLEKVIGNNITIQNGVISQDDVSKSARIDIPIPISTTGTYTISFNSNKSRDFWIRNGQVNSGYITHIATNETTKTFKISDLVDGYIRLDCFGAPTGYEPFVLSNIQLEKSSIATPYEPYQEPLTTDIYLDEPLCKVGDYSDYIDFENQVVVRNVKKYLLNNTPDGGKTLYTWLDKKGVVFTNVLDNKYNISKNALCNRNSYWTANGAETLTMWLGVNTKSVYWIGILDYLGFTTVEEFNEWLANNPTYLLYGSDNPTTSPIELPQLPTFKGTTIYSIDTTIQPSNMEVKYYSNERSVS